VRYAGPGVGLLVAAVVVVATSAAIPDALPRGLVVAAAFALAGLFAIWRRLAFRSKVAAVMRAGESSDVVVTGVEGWFDRTGLTTWVYVETTEGGHPFASTLLPWQRRRVPPRGTPATLVGHTDDRRPLLVVVPRDGEPLWPVGPAQRLRVGTFANRTLRRS
jgi:hypothetical protein